VSSGCWSHARSRIRKSAQPRHCRTDKPTHTHAAMLQAHMHRAQRSAITSKASMGADHPVVTKVLVGPSSTVDTPPLAPPYPPMQHLLTRRVPHGNVRAIGTLTEARSPHSSHASASETPRPMPTPAPPLSVRNRPSFHHGGTRSARDSKTRLSRSSHILNMPTTRGARSRHGVSES
jgi:hypothetical protein